MSNFGNKIYERRRMLDLTQADLAKSIGTERAFVSRLETGAHTNITMDVLQKLATALKTTPENLIR